MKAKYDITNPTMSRSSSAFQDVSGGYYNPSLYWKETDDPEGTLEVNCLRFPAPSDDNLVPSYTKFPPSVGAETHSPEALNKPFPPDLGQKPSIGTVSFCNSKSPHVHILCPEEKRAQLKSPQVPCDWGRSSAEKISPISGPAEGVQKKNSTRCCSQITKGWTSIASKYIICFKLATLFLLLTTTIFLGFICYYRKEGIRSFFERSSLYVCETPECVMAAGAIMSSMDQSVLPCEDFYSFACGGWMSQNPPPPTFDQWNNFAIATEKIHHGLKRLLERSSAEDETKVIREARKFYKACTNEKTERSLFHLAGKLD